MPLVSYSLNMSMYARDIVKSVTFLTEKKRWKLSKEFLTLLLEWNKTLVLEYIAM